MFNVAKIGVRLIKNKKNGNARLACQSFLEIIFILYTFASKKWKSRKVNMYLSVILCRGQN